MSKAIGIKGKSYMAKDEPEAKELVLVPPGKIEVLNFQSRQPYSGPDNPKSGKTWIGIKKLEDRSAVAIIDYKCAIVAHVAHKPDSAGNPPRPVEDVVKDIKKVGDELQMFGPGRRIQAFLIHPRELTARCMKFPGNKLSASVHEGIFFLLSDGLRDIVKVPLLEMSFHPFRVGAGLNPTPVLGSPPEVDPNIFEIHGKTDGHVSVYLEGSIIHDFVPSPNPADDPRSTTS